MGHGSFLASLATTALLTGSALAQNPPAVSNAETTAAPTARVKLLARLVAAKSPAELIAIAEDISKPSWDRRTEGASGFPRELDLQLKALAVAWSSKEPQFLRRDYGPDSEFWAGPEPAALRQRVEREVISHFLEVPELNQPPFDGMAVLPALNRLTDQLATSGEWRRILRLHRFRHGTGRFGAFDRREIEFEAAIQFFIIGQNFERAGLRMDAAAAYKTVLRSTDERAPIKESAERLKALNKSHLETSTVVGATPSAPATSSHGPLPQP